MENKKIIIIALLVCFCISISCTNKENKHNTTVLTEEKNNITNEELSQSSFLSDTCLLFLKENLSISFQKRGLEFQIDSVIDINNIKYSYNVINKFTYTTRLDLDVNIYESEEEAKNKVKEDKKRVEEAVLESEYGIRTKIGFFSFRLDRNIYSISSTENISHIRSEVFSGAIKYFKIKDVDILFE